MGKPEAISVTARRQCAARSQGAGNLRMQVVAILLKRPDIWQGELDQLDGDDDEVQFRTCNSVAVTRAERALSGYYQQSFAVSAEPAERLTKEGTMMAVHSVYNWTGCR